MNLRKFNQTCICGRSIPIDNSGICAACERPIMARRRVTVTVQKLLADLPAKYGFGMWRADIQGRILTLAGMYQEKPFTIYLKIKNGQLIFHKLVGPSGFYQEYLETIFSELFWETTYVLKRK